MSDIHWNLSSINWNKVSEDLSSCGYSIMPSFMSENQCINLIKGFDKDSAFRKTVFMERHRFGLGVYKYWDYPLPEYIQTLRTSLYPHLVPIANNWMRSLNIGTTFPDNLDELTSLCRDAGQSKPTPLILKYGKDGYNTLHQDIYGDVYFPIQIACFLSEPDVDYTGGEFVLTEQIPRAQSKAIVLKPSRGDIVIFATSFRPAKGSNRYYRINMRHGVSKVHSGTRYVSGIIFHDAVN